MLLSDLKPDRQSAKSPERERGGAEVLLEANGVDNEKFNSFSVQLKKILASNGHVFYQELAFCFL